MKREQADSFHEMFRGSFLERLEGCKGETHKGDRRNSARVKKSGKFRVFSWCFLGVFRHCQGFSGIFGSFREGSKQSKSTLAHCPLQGGVMLGGSWDICCDGVASMSFPVSACVSISL